MRKARVLVSAAAILCASSAVFAQENVPSIEAVMKPGESTEKPTLRIKLVREAAISAAMRASLAKQSEKINKMLDTNARLLDDTYDFPSLMLPNNVVPPVIRKVERVTEQQGDVLRYSALQFQIVKQATFATRAPSWREYLPIPIWTDLGTTPPSLFPTNGAETVAAREGIQQGWRAGIEQANEMFFKGLTRLQNDWLGMNTYHALLKSNMVTAPIINRQDVPISGDATSMVVDESTYRIEAKPVFNPSLSQWLALVDKSSTSHIFEEINKPSVAEEARAKLTVPSESELMTSWNVR